MFDQSNIGMSYRLNPCIKLISILFSFRNGKEKLHPKIDHGSSGPSKRAW